MRASELSRRIAVDLLAIQPGGANGGAKLLALDLIEGLSSDFVMTCFCKPEAKDEIAARLCGRVHIISVENQTDLERAYDAQVATNGTFALNFFPMQRVTLVRAGTRCVSVIHDLQFADLPENFTPREQAERRAALRSCIEHSDLIVTVSDFSRSRIEAITGIDRRRIRVIANALASAPTNLSIRSASNVRPDPYFLYPANFWPHKNHTRLLEAYRAYRRASSDPLDLVLTGEITTAEPAFAQQLVAETGLVVTGYVVREELLELLKGATAVVFPSLYEGFGMPVVEAMTAGIPVACSNAGSLPEIAGDAALIFDATDHSAMAEALGSLASDATLRATLIAAGHRRVDELGGFTEMLDAYRKVLEEVMTAPTTGSAALQGADIAGWAGCEVILDLTESETVEHVQLQLSLPVWAPLPCQILMISTEHRFIAQKNLWAGHSRSIDLQIIPGERTVNITALHHFRLGEVINTTRHDRVAYKLDGATMFANGRRINVWPPAALGTVPRDVAVAVLEGSPETGVTVFAICASPQPVAIRLNPAIANNQIVFESNTLPLSVNSATAPVPRIELPPSASLPSLHMPKGIDLITCRKIDHSWPVAIEDRPPQAGFSVIIPSYNQGRFIARTIDSALEQDGVCEIMVLDGGSTDNTLDVLASYGDRIVWHSGKDAGQADAVNLGLARARGEYIAWINSDDTYAPGAFSHVAKIFTADSGVGVVYGDGHHIDEEDRFIDAYPTADFDAILLRKGCFICQPAAFFRRSVVVRHGGLRVSLRYCLDYEFWLRLSAAGVRFTRTRRLLAHSRMYAANKTIGERLPAYFETADMMIDSFGHESSAWVEHFANATADLLGDKYQIPRAFALREARRLALAIWPSVANG